MDDKVNFLREAGAAALNRAYERLFAGVNPQMIDEVVPFSEIKTAMLVITFQNGHHPISFWILELINFIFLSLWHLRFHLKRISIECLTALHVDSGSLGN